MEETTHALFSIGPLEVTGTVTTMWAIIIVLTLLSWLATRNMKEVPGKLQNIAEMAVGSLQNYFNGTLGTRLCKKYFPVFATFFIFIIVSNYSGLLPGAGHLKAFHVPTASLSVYATWVWQVPSPSCCVTPSTPTSYRQRSILLLSSMVVLSLILHMVVQVCLPPRWL